MPGCWRWWWAAWGCGVLLATPGCGARPRRALPASSGAVALPASVVWAEPFERIDSARWRTVNVNRQTDYDTVTVDGRTCLRARSHNGASILVSQVRVDPGMAPWLSWEWRVDRPVDGESLTEQRGSDAAARVYVYFKTVGLPWQQRSLDYVWSSTLPVGSLLSSAYSSVSKIIVAEHGNAAVGRWHRVERNLREDFLRAFGEPAPPVVALGVMTDTDTLHGDALAYFDELRLSREPMTDPHGR